MQFCTNQVAPQVANQSQRQYNGQTKARVASVSQRGLTKIDFVAYCPTPLQYTRVSVGLKVLIGIVRTPTGPGQCEIAIDIFLKCHLHHILPPPPPLVLITANIDLGPGPKWAREAGVGLAFFSRKIWEHPTVMFL